MKERQERNTKKFHIFPKQLINFSLENKDNLVKLDLKTLKEYKFHDDDFLINIERNDFPEFVDELLVESEMLINDSNTEIRLSKWYSELLNDSKKFYDINIKDFLFQDERHLSFRKIKLRL